MTMSIGRSPKIFRSIPSWGHCLYHTQIHHHKQDVSFAKPWRNERISIAIKLLEVYSRRELTHDQDALRAVVSSLNILIRQDKQLGQYWGIPFKNPHARKQNTAKDFPFFDRPVERRHSIDQISVDLIDEVAERKQNADKFSIALHWFHMEQCRRRRDFPT